MMKPEMSSKLMKDALSDEEIAEVDFEGEMIKSLKELEKSRNKNTFFKEKLAKHKEQVEETRKFNLEIMEQLAHQEEKCEKMEEQVIRLK